MMRRLRVSWPASRAGRVPGPASRAGRLVGLVPLLGLLVSAQPAGAAATAVFHRPIISLNANQSTNWSGYNQGFLEQGGKQFNAVSGDWTVPTATAHTKGTPASSATWTGIGGGCVDASCVVTDATLIQAGTEQDVDSSGHATYSAWWEIIPAPSITISSMTIHPGDRMHVAIGQTAPEVWTITVQDLTHTSTFTQTVPYPSDFSTAEWIEETPTQIGTGGVGMDALPNLSTVNFNQATVNGANPKLASSEEIQLVDSNNKPLATPSAPNATTNGFNVCAYASTCSVPSSTSLATIHNSRHSSRSH